MKRIFSLMLLCAAVIFSGCGKDDPDPDPTPIPVTGVTLDKTSLSLEIGKTATLVATITPKEAEVVDVVWSSDKPAVAAVNDKGVVTAVAEGTATITVKTEDGGKTATCVVTVLKGVIAVTEVKLNKTEISINVGGTDTLTVTVLPENATNKTVTWSSSDAAIATINATTGEVEGKAEGEVTITVTATDGSGVTDTCKVTVEDKSNYIEVNGIKVAVGNLVADGANGVKIGTATDIGLFFQFGSLIGWSTTGSPALIVSPVGYTGSTTWNSSWKGDPATENVATGTGDLCKYYLKGTWRLPTKDEYVALFKDGGYPSGTWEWQNSSATHSTTNLTFPASGYRSASGGELNDVGTVGYIWSASPNNASLGYDLSFYDSTVNPSDISSRALGFPVRCVRGSN